MKPLFVIGLRGRLILLILVAFAIIFAVILQHTVAHRAENIANATERLLHSTKLIAARQQLMQTQAEAILNDLMTRAELRANVSTEACSHFLAARAKQEQAFIQIAKTLPNGDLACAAVPSASRVNFADRRWFQSALKSENMVISEGLTSRTLNQSVVVFAKAMRSDTGRVTEVLFLSLDLSWLQQELAHAELPEEARLVLVDSSGMVLVYHPDDDGRANRNIAQTPLFQAITAHGRQGTVEEVGLNGKPRVIAFTPLLNTVTGPVTLWLGVPKEIVTAAAQRELATSLSIAATLLMLVIAMIFLGGETLLVRPLRRLILAVARFGSGEFGVRTGLPHGSDDIGRLAHAFDNMAGLVQAGKQKLARANHALRVLSAGNSTLLRCKTEQELTEEMCRTLIESGGYLIAWVGYAGDDKRVRTGASWNSPEGFFDGLNITLDETASGCGPTGTAIRRGISVATNTISDNPDYAPWRERAQRYGYAASLALPLCIDDEVIGALNIYATEPDAFDEEVINLLGEFAANLSFGIATLRGEITQERTQAALKAAEEYFSAVAAASLDALFVLQSVRSERDEIIDFEFVEINPRAEQMLNMTRDKVIGQKLCELIPVNRTGGFFDKYVTVATTGTPLEEEFPIDSPEIKAKWMRHQVVQVGDGIAISSRDITQWKQASAEIRRQTRLRTAILNAAGEGIFGLDTGGRATFINPAGVEMLQWPEKELVGQVMHALHHHTRVDGTAYPAKACPIYAAYRDGQVHRMEDEVFWRKDGTSFPVEYVSTPVFDEQGVLSGAVVSFSDISERKARDTALAHAVRAMKTLSTVNQSLVHATDEPQLLQEICRGIVDKGGYRMAWVGYADDNPEKTITPIAWAGVEDGYLVQLKLTWADTERGQGTAGRTIRTGKAQTVHDIHLDPGYALWREQAEKHGYASSYSYPLTVEGRLIGALCIYAAETDAFDEGEITLLAELGDDLAYGIEMLRTRAERDRTAYVQFHHAEILQRSLEDSIRAIAYTVEMRDPYTAGHERRVGELAVAIAKEMGLSEHKIQGIRLAASVHDLGKINIPAEILSKPGKLSDIEFMLIQTHPLAGYNILRDVEFPWPIAEIVLQHHEKMDGSGYPQGLKAEEILLESRVMTVADVVEAMSSHRPYRPTLGIEVALKEIERGKGSIYDLEVAEACLKLFREERFSFQG